MSGPELLLENKMAPPPSVVSAGSPPRQVPPGPKGGRRYSLRPNVLPLTEMSGPAAGSGRNAPAVGDRGEAVGPAGTAEARRDDDDLVGLRRCLQLE